MEIIKPTIYVNEFQIVVGINELLKDENGVIYSPLPILVGMLDIAKRDVLFYPDIQEIHIIKNNNTMKVNENEIVFNNMSTLNNGFITFNGARYLPTKFIIEQFGGSLEEIDNQLNITI